MATILPFVRDGVFDHEDITVMSAALDDVCKMLNLRDDNSAREVIAIRIIDLARAGERSPWTKFARPDARRGIDGESGCNREQGCAI
jgi:hypothetical protein